MKTKTKKEWNNPPSYNNTNNYKEKLHIDNKIKSINGKKLSTQRTKKVPCLFEINAQTTLFQKNKNISQHEFGMQTVSTQRFVFFNSPFFVFSPFSSIFVSSCFFIFMFFFIIFFVLPSSFSFRLRFFRKDQTGVLVCRF